MGKAITELGSFAGPVVDATKLPVATSDTLESATASQLKTYMAIPATTDALTEGSTNLYSTAARIRATVLTGLSTAAGTVVAATHTILEAIGFLQKQVSDNTTAISGKQATLVSATNIKTINSTSLLGAGDIAISASPAGSTTQVQYNNAGAFAGHSAFTYDGAGQVTATSFKAQKVNYAPMIGTGLTSTDAMMTWGTGNVLHFLRGDAVTWVNTKANIFTAQSSFAWASAGMDYVNNGVAITQSAGGSLFRNMTAGHFYPQAYNSSDYSYDVALGKSASGIAEINSGTAGTWRDLKLRNLIGTGNLATGIVAKSADYTATTSDGTIEVDATAGAKTITLFAASANAGKILVIKKTDSSVNAVTIDGNASETIDGATTISLAIQYSTATIQVNAAGTAWHKLSGI